MSKSAVPIVRKALFNDWINLDTVADVAAEGGVLLGFRPERPKEAILLGHVDQGSWTTEWVVLGELKRDERFKLKVAFTCETPGVTFEESTDRVFELYGAIETRVREPGYSALIGLNVDPDDPLVIEGPWIEPTDHVEVALIDSDAAKIEATIYFRTRN